MIRKVISGGQTGADQAGLHVAREFGLQTGGHVPNGYRTVFGPQPSLAEFGMVQTASSNYVSRTKRNVHNSDATVRLATNFQSPGELLTLKFCKEAGKLVFDVTLGNEQSYDGQASLLAAWILAQKIQVLNVAGNADRDIVYGRHFRDAALVLRLTFVDLGLKSEEKWPLL